MFGCQFDDEELYIVDRDVINYILSPKVLGMKLKCKGRVTVYPGLSPCILSQ